MGELEKTLITEAEQKYGRIKPCVGKRIDECFTQYKGKLLFWFKDEDKDTRIVSKAI